MPKSMHSQAFDQDESKRRRRPGALAGLALAGLMAILPAPAVRAQGDPGDLVQAVIDGRTTIVQVMQGMSGRAVAAAAGPSVEVGSASGAPGDMVMFPVILHTAGALVAAMQADIAFDSLNTPVAANGSGRPDCMVNPAINKNESVFAFQPPGCVGAACTAFRALVLSFTNVDPIADGSVLYTCNVAIAPGAAAGSYPLTLSNFILATPDGEQVADVTATDGAVDVSGSPPPTPTPSGPTDKEQCKHGGWRTFTAPRVFRNQGDCIQFVNTGK